MRIALTSSMCALVLAGSVLSGQAPETVDREAIAAIRDEALNRSQVMDTAFWLSDRYGPRLDGSPEYDEAADWAMARMAGWGVTNLHKERFASGPGWSLRNFHATMLEPRVMPIIGYPLAWSVGTNGVVRAEVVRASIATAEEAEQYRGQLAGKIVLTQPAREVRMLEYGDGPVIRYDDEDGRWREEAMTAPSSRRLGLGTMRISPDAFDLHAFLSEEGVVAVFSRGPSSDMVREGSGLTWMQQRPDGGTIFVQDRMDEGRDPGTLVPSVRLAVEHYNRMVRLIEHGVPVTVELNVDVAFTPEEEAGSFNIIGEIPGTDLADEVVLIGAHFDSWHAATGATDNAAGAAVMMEVLRVLRATGLEPRRTVRIALWGKEETGLHGSAHHAMLHYGTPGQPAAAYERFAAYFNLDNGTGPIRGVWMQDNAAVAPIFRAWAEPLVDLGVDLFSPRAVTGTDHESFDALGLPAFQFVQERYEYNSRTHHSNMDFYDRLQADDLKQAAAVAGAFVWQAATRDDVLPRRVSAFE